MKNKIEAKIMIASNNQIARNASKPLMPFLYLLLLVVFLWFIL